MEFISFSNCFHGRTVDVVALISKEHYRSPFESVMQELLSRSEGGIYSATKYFLQVLKTAYDTADSLIVLYKDSSKELEVIVRENGVVPTTITILDGVPCIGLTIEELEILARLGSKAQEIATRDIALVVRAGENCMPQQSLSSFKYGEVFPRV
ncbi:hypothetical protein KY285_009120 [Solanum tuberosum]|nr:hypothetical protein KY285_009120 [Solanum tuberosum]